MSWTGRAVAALAGMIVLGAMVAGWLASRDLDAPRASTVAARMPGEADPRRDATPPARAAAPVPPREIPPADEPLAPLLSPSASDEPFIDEEGRPSRALVRNAIELAIEEHHSSHKLSEDDVERLTSAVLRIREARLALAELPEDEALAPLRRELVQEIEAAGREFAEVMEMGLDEFTAGAGGGVDRFDPDEPLPEPEFLTEPTR